MYLNLARYPINTFNAQAAGSCSNLSLLNKDRTVPDESQFTANDGERILLRYFDRLQRWIYLTKATVEDSINVR
jgi:hypothetical protein